MSTDMKKRIKEFEEHLRTERRLSGHTITSYQRDLEKLAIWCAESELLLENITTHDIRACLSVGTSFESIVKAFIISEVGIVSLPFFANPFAKQEAIGLPFLIIFCSI